VGPFDWPPAGRWSFRITMLKALPGEVTVPPSHRRGDDPEPFP
jgi:hypothetical protein